MDIFFIIALSKLCGKPQVYSIIMRTTYILLCTLLSAAYPCKSMLLLLCMGCQRTRFLTINVRIHVTKVASGFLYSFLTY